MKPVPINVLNGGGFMKKCSRCGRLKATFASDPKGHRSIGSVCWTCWTASRLPRQRNTTNPEAAAPPPAARRGRPRTGGVFRRGTVWWVRYTPAPGADEVRESSGSRERDDAVRLLNARLALCENPCARNVRETA